jgi:hypothetical protein
VALAPRSSLCAGSAVLNFAEEIEEKAKAVAKVIESNNAVLRRRFVLRLTLWTLHVGVTRASMRGLLMA